MDITITKQDFMDYESIGECITINGFDVKKIREPPKLDLDKVLRIMKNYDRYKKEFMGKANDIQI